LFDVVFRFVDIDGFVDHLCLYFFLYEEESTKQLCDYPIDVLLVTYISVAQWLACSPQVW
jgi:hypothetical protein